MKKIKILLPLAGIATLGAAPIVTLASCNKWNTSVKSIAINASSTYTENFEDGDKFSSSGLKIDVEYSNGEKETISSGFTTDWDGETFSSWDIGKQTVTVTYQDKTCTYTINVSAILAGITASVDSSTYVVGDSISKDDITVYAYYTDGTTKEITDKTDCSWTWTIGETVIPWVSTEAHQFTTEGEAILTIGYGDKKISTATISFNAVKAEYFTFGLEPISLVVDTSANAAYSTGTPIHIYGYNTITGLHEVNAGLFDISGKDASSGDEIVDWDKSNKILYGLAPGHVTNLVAKLSGVEGYEVNYGQLTIRDASDVTNVPFTAKIENSEATVTLIQGDGLNENTCTIPSYVKNATAPYPVTTIEIDQTPETETTRKTALNTLIIPETVKTIDGKFNVGDGDEPIWSPEKQPQTIYYEGKSDDWNKITCTEGWQGDIAIGAYCLKEVTEESEYKFVKFTHCVDSEYDKDGTMLKATETVGSVAQDDFTIEFDYSQIPATETLANFKYIEASNAALAPLIGNLTIDAVYLDGAKLEKDTHYTTSETSKREATLTFVDGQVTITAYSKVVIKLHTPSGSQDAITGRRMITVTAHKEA